MVNKSYIIPHQGNEFLPGHKLKLANPYIFTPLWCTLRYFKLGLFYLTEFVVYTIEGLYNLVAKI